MDDTQRPTASRLNGGEDAASFPTALDERRVTPHELPSLEVQARCSCDAASRRYQTVAARFTELEASFDASSEAARHLLEARLHLDAAKLAWFNTVVHYERVKARQAWSSP